MGDFELLKRHSSYNPRPIFNVDNPNYGRQRSCSRRNQEESPSGSSSERSYADDDRFLSEGAHDRHYLNYYHRTTSVHRNIFKHGTSTYNFRAVPSLEHRKKWLFCTGCNVQDASLQERADDIAKSMELDDALMENTHESELLRREALRDMPQCLTVKRIIKRNLSLSVTKQSRGKPISCFKSLQYSLSMKWSKISTYFKSFAYSFELWYSSLKEIEGHFGSGVATYFKYFRWIFIMNLLITFVALPFMVFPQLLFENFTTATENSKSVWFNWELKQTANNVSFAVADLFTGEGYFTDTVLYYGHYTNDTINLIGSQWYSVPYAYFFTSFLIYVVSFVALSLSMARSYRKSFIETQDSVKNNFAHKVFCGWDYSVATEKAADLKVSLLYNELKELLSESLETEKHTSCLQSFYTRVLQVICNIIIALLLVGIGYILWLLLDENIDNMNDSSSSNVGLIIAVVINIIMLFFPIAFGFIVHYEDYKHPRAALYITLLRTFLLKVVLVGTFLAFWLKHSRKQKCWETAIGQHIYRLILFDFFFSVILSSIVDAICYLIYKYVWRGIGAPTFDIARYSLQLLYNQTLFWVGFYFSPLLCIVVVLKLWLSWYIRRACTLNFCQPYSKSWKAAQTQTLFLILSFLSLLLVIITLGYIMVDVKASECGPLRNYSYMYELILKGIFQLEHHNVFWRVLMYLTKPGTVALILLAMCVIVYYLRARAIAQKGIVNILRDMLVLEAKDKEFLLETFSKVAEKCSFPTNHRAYSIYENITDVWSPGERDCNNKGANLCSSSSQTWDDVEQHQLIDQSLPLKSRKPISHKKKHR